MDEVAITISLQEWNKHQSMVIEMHTMLKKLVAATEKELLTPKEVCEWLKINRDTFQRYADKGLFTLTQLDGKGSKVYVKRSEIDKLIEEGKV